MTNFGTRDNNSNVAKLLSAILSALSFRNLPAKL